MVKPEERRELFDEAAGIVKFKKRKAAAEKNLETERQNLLRVQDILTELEKQVGPLEEQSKKAKEFLQLKEELKQFEVGLFCMDYETLQQETEEIEKNLSHTKEELEQAKADKEKSRSEYDSVESAIADFDRSAKAVRLQGVRSGSGQPGAVQTRFAVDDLSTAQGLAHHGLSRTAGHRYIQTDDGQYPAGIVEGLIHRLGAAHGGYSPEIKHIACGCQPASAQWRRHVRDRSQ